MHLEVFTNCSLKRVGAFVPDRILISKVLVFEALREENERGVCFVYDYITAEYCIWLFQYDKEVCFWHTD